MTVKAEGTQEFVKAAHALNDLGNRKVRLAVYKGFRNSARPLGQSMVRAGAAAMPKRGGLSERVASSSVGISNATTGRNPRVELRLKTPQGYDLKAMDAGELRHPVFARANAKRTWVRQGVPAGSFTAAFEEGAPGVRAELIRELNTVIDETARKRAR